MTLKYALESSANIVKRAINDIRPYAVLAAISGGKDSLCAYHVALHLGIKVHFIIHCRTGTGIPQTTEFVRQFAQSQSCRYLEADAGNAYEEYVRRKGFFGTGVHAHTFSYHILKHQRFVTAIARNIRRRKHNRPAMIINGARIYESANRFKNFKEPVRQTHDTNDWWVNICHTWTKEDRDEFLELHSVPVNPVTKLLCRSGECMCGTMQTLAQREEAAFYYPEWGRWLNLLESEVRMKFGFGWGESPLEIQKQIARPIFQPMCTDCLDDSADTL